MPSLISDNLSTHNYSLQLFQEVIFMIALQIDFIIFIFSPAVNSACMNLFPTKMPKGKIYKMAKRWTTKK